VVFRQPGNQAADQLLRRGGVLPADQVSGERVLVADALRLGQGFAQQPPAPQRQPGGEPGIIGEGALEPVAENLRRFIGGLDLFDELPCFGVDVV
jgi:hypothetical protein